MTSTTLTRSALAILAAGALAAPGAAEAKGGRDHDHAHRSHDDVQSSRDGGKAARNPTVGYIFKGTVVSVDAAGGTAVIKVRKTNRHGGSVRNATVTFDLTNAKVAVADVNADGVADVADVAAGDKVLVRARLRRGAPDLTAAVVARKLVDQSRPRRETDDDTEDRARS